MLTRRVPTSWPGHPRKNTSWRQRARALSSCYTTFAKQGTAPRPCTHTQATHSRAGIGAGKCTARRLLREVLCWCARARTASASQCIRWRPAPRFRGGAWAMMPPRWSVAEQRATPRSSRQRLVARSSSSSSRRPARHEQPWGRCAREPISGVPESSTCNNVCLKDPWPPQANTCWQEHASGAGKRCTGCVRIRRGLLRFLATHGGICTPPLSRAHLAWQSTLSAVASTRISSHCRCRRPRRCTGPPRRSP